MYFEDSIRRGFELALSEGLDLFYGLSSVLVAAGERFDGGMGLKSVLSLLSRPRLFLRLAKAWLKSRLARRAIWPKDLWSPKGLVSAGADASVYRERIKTMWGRYPLHVYGATESIVLAVQTWDYEGMTFVPHFNFLEFVPEDEQAKLRKYPSHQPATLLLDEVRPGERYEMVITSFMGGAFVRYRIGDLVKITALRNNKLNIDIPQMEFEGRADDLIDVAGFTRLTEKTIGQAIEGIGLAYEDWTVRKEAREKPVLHLYLELKPNGHRSEVEVATAIHEQLKSLDHDYADLERMLGLKPLEVTLLPSWTFREYVSKQKAAGAELGQLKPPRLNASDADIEALLHSVHPC